jgi:nucleotide-binding universal stress UspA family protein
VVLLHAHSDPFESLGYMGLGLGVEQPIPLEDYQGAVATDLERIASGLRGAVKSGVRTEVILDSHYGRAIADWCNANGVDLTVVGTMGKPGMRYWLLGSTAEYVLKETESAVLAVRGHE